MKSLVWILIITVLFSCQKQDTSTPSASYGNTPTQYAGLIGIWKQDSSRKNGIMQYDSTSNNTVRFYDTIYVTQSSFREAQWTLITPRGEVFGEGLPYIWQTTFLDSLLLSYKSGKYTFREAYRYAIIPTLSSKILSLTDTSGQYWFHPIK